MLVIIQPATRERVLSGVCYKASWLLASARYRGRPAVLREEVGLYDVDDIFDEYGKRAQYVVDLSSYPQLGLAQQIAREFRDYSPRFIGLDPLIGELGLRPYDPAADGLDYAQGAFNYDLVASGLRFRRHSDYDAHLAVLDDGRAWAPAFFSVGCDRKCPYCYVNFTQFPRASVPLDDARRIVDRYAESGHNQERLVAMAQLAQLGVVR